MKEKSNEIVIGVFPFENLADGAGNDFFCKSLYYDLVTELSRFRQFRIIASQSLQYDGQSLSDTFNYVPDYVIRGSVRSISGTIRINAQLFLPESNQIIWADHFEGNPSSVRDMQDLLLEKIAASLQQQLNYDLLSQIRIKNRTNASAYEYWLYGMEELKRGTLEADETARDLFQKAIDIDPAYSLAYSGMSLTFFNEWSCQLWERWEASRHGAYEWARKAIDLDAQNYVAAVVLGRVHLYEGNYDLSEHFLRRALRLNSNDIDYLIQLASCFVFLGYPEEAHVLHERVLQLHPINADNYRHIEAFIALERGDFRRTLETGRNVVAPWIDFEAFLAAAAYHAGRFDEMNNYWQRFLKKFSEKILKNPSASPAEAVQWLRVVNPYKGESNFGVFLAFILNSSPEGSAAGETPANAVPGPTYAFVKRSNFWEVTFNGASIFAIELKGYFDLARMLANPEKEFHCTELMGAVLHGDGEPVFDEKAKRAYRKKLQELKDEMDELEHMQNPERQALLQAEYDSLLRHLSSSLGMGGKSRKANDPVEKVRSAVTWRIRKAIQKFEKEHPALGKHLSVSVKTGVFCSYRPEAVPDWVVAF